jgi:recombination protein RecT
MENNELVKAEGSSLTKFRSLLSQDVIKKKFEEALGKKAPMFVSNLTTIMSGSAELQKCDHMSVISSALMAASMDLPLTPGLGFAGIVPYFDGPSQQMKAQFQVMKKGFIQLAQRTGLFKIINVSEVCEGEMKSHNKFTGEYIFDETGKKSDNIIGYVSYFRLINGFEKFYYMPIEKLDTHAKRYSKSFQRGKGKWADKEEGGYEQMCEKTVLKLNLSTYAPLSVDINMMNAIVYDQAEIRDVEAKDYDYVDNEDSKQPEVKDVIDIGGGKTIVVNKSHEAKSQQMSAKASDKIKAPEFAPIKSNVSDAVVVNEDTVNVPEPFSDIPSKVDFMDIKGESRSGNVIIKDESPFIPSKGSTEFLDGKEVTREVSGDNSTTMNLEYPGHYTLEGMEKMDTEVLKEIVMADMDMMEASEMIPGRNTNKKLREIIFAHQNNGLREYVAAMLPKPSETPVEPPADTARGEIPLNKDFDNQGPAQGTPTRNADILQPDPPKEKVVSGNKYNLEIPEAIPRDFSVMKSLHNKLLMLSPTINNSRYEDLADKLNIRVAFQDKETFLKNATTAMINQLLDTN